MLLFLYTYLLFLLENPHFWLTSTLPMCWLLICSIPIDNGLTHRLGSLLIKIRKIQCSRGLINRMLLRNFAANIVNNILVETVLSKKSQKYSRYKYKIIMSSHNSFSSWYFFAFETYLTHAQLEHMYIYIYSHERFTFNRKRLYIIKNFYNSVIFLQIERICDVFETVSSQNDSGKASLTNRLFL